MNTMEHHFEHTAMKSCEPVGGALHPRVVFSRMNARCCWNCPVDMLLIFLVETSTKYLDLRCSGRQLGFTEGFFL